MLRIQTTKDGYQPEIDGLRAIAVLAVLCYHLNIGDGPQQIFSGGFLGVDVFFVISGFLISRILIREMRIKSPHLLRNFWIRRIRRIFPLLLVVVTSSSIAAWFLLGTKAFREYANSAFAAILSFSNFHFFSEDSYIAESSDTKPLLHTWSLAVEEQFYLVFPLLLVLSFKFLRKPSAVVWGLLALSLISSVTTSISEPSFNFYSTTSRSWELAAGALAAFVPQRRPNQALSILGILLVTISFLVVRDTYWHPSPTWTLMPVLGAVLVILYSARTTFVGKALASKPMVAIGLVSFGLYLWHWPIIAFLNYRGLEGAWVTAVEITLPLVLASVTYVAIEKPFRDKRRMPQKQLLTIVAVGLVALLASIGSLKSDFASGFRMGTSMSLTNSFERADLESFCGLTDPNQIPDADFCLIGDSEASPDFMLIGDSHALSLLDAFDQIGKSQGRAILFAYQAGCPPLVGIYPDRKPQESLNCKKTNDRIDQEITGGGIRTVAMVSRWNFYWTGDPYVPLSRVQGKFNADSRTVFKDAFISTVNKYSQFVDELLILEDTPAQPVNPEVAYSSGLELYEQSLRTFDYVKQKLDFRRVLAEIQLPNNVGIFDPEPFVCDENICPIGTSTRSYYFDDDHLSVSGASRLVDPLLAAFAAGFGN